MFSDSPIYVASYNHCSHIWTVFLSTLIHTDRKYTYKYDLITRTNRKDPGLEPGEQVWRHSILQLELDYWTKSGQLWSVLHLLYLLSLVWFEETHWFSEVLKYVVLPLYDRLELENKPEASNGPHFEQEPQFKSPTNESPLLIGDCCKK